MIRETTLVCPNCQSELNVRFFDVVTVDETIRKQLEENEAEIERRGLEP